MSLPFSPNKSRLIGSIVSKTQQQKQDPENQEESEPEVATDVPKNILLILLPLTISIVLFLTAYESLTKDLHSPKSVDSARRVLKRVQENLEAPVLYQIDTKDANDACQAGYSPLPVGIWQGISSGCYCQDGTTIDTHKCIYRTDCRFVTSREPREILKWASAKSAKILTFCAKKDEGLKREVKCAESQTQCASDLCKAGAGDNLCPFNSITCTGDIGLKKTHMKNELEHKSVDLSFSFSSVNDKKNTCAASFKSNEVSNDRPFVEIQTTHQSGVVCLDPYTDTIRKDAKQQAIPVDYPLYTQQNVDLCGEYGEIQNGKKTLTYSLNSQKSSTDIFTLNDIQTTIVDNVPKEFSNQDYQLFLNIVGKIQVALKDSCIKFDLNNFKGLSTWGRASATFVHVVDWFILIGSAISFIICLVFFGSLVSNALATQEKTKIQIARYYVIWSFLLVALALACSLIYWAIFRQKLNSYNTLLTTFSTDNCIAEPAGVNKAITNINSHERQVIDFYDQQYKWWAWSSIAYCATWFILSKLR